MVPLEKSFYMGLGAGNLMAGNGMNSSFSRSPRGSMGDTTGNL
jgi:hypothetical protein